MDKPLTMEVFQQALPAVMRKNVNQNLLDQINNTLGHPEILAAFKDNLLDYATVLNTGKYRMSNYISAVKYVSFKLMGSTNIEAYTKTFPDKYAQFLADGVNSKDIASYCTAYHKSKLVMAIMEQTIIPSHILNAPMYQQALNVLSDLMLNANSEKVRCESANNILAALKRPETQKIELDIGINRGEIIEDYEKAMRLMVEKQQELISAGGDLKMITNATIKSTEEQAIQ